MNPTNISKKQSKGEAQKGSEFSHAESLIEFGADGELGHQGREPNDQWFLTGS